MITDYNVTSYITDDCYENYYRKVKFTDEAEKYDREYEDSLWEEN